MSDLIATDKHIQESTPQQWANKIRTCVSNLDHLTDIVQSLLSLVNLSYLFFHLSPSKLIRLVIFLPKKSPPPLSHL